MKKARLSITTASLLATMASKKKLRLSNRHPATASTERTRSSSSIQNQRAELQLLLATKAGQEQSMNAPSSSAKKPHLASTAGQGYFIFTAEGERRTGRREDIDEDGATPRLPSLRPSEQRESKQQPKRDRDLAAEISTTASSTGHPPKTVATATNYQRKL
jgi:hypothetical protein